MGELRGPMTGLYDVFVDWPGRLARALLAPDGLLLLAFKAVRLTAGLAGPDASAEVEDVVLSARPPGYRNSRGD